MWIRYYSSLGTAKMIASFSYCDRCGVAYWVSTYVFSTSHNPFWPTRGDLDARDPHKAIFKGENGAGWKKVRSAGVRRFLYFIFPVLFSLFASSKKKHLPYLIAAACLWDRTLLQDVGLTLNLKFRGKKRIHFGYANCYDEGHRLFFKQDIRWASEFIRFCLLRICGVDIQLQLVAIFLLHSLGYPYSPSTRDSRWVSTMKNRQLCHAHFLNFICAVEGGGGGADPSAPFHLSFNLDWNCNPPYYPTRAYLWPSTG